MAFLDNNFYGGIGFGGGPNPYSGMGGMQNNNIYGPQPFNDVISLNYQNGGGAAATPSSGVSVSPVVNPRPSILTPPSSGGAGVGVAPIDVILNDDVATKKPKGMSDKYNALPISGSAFGPDIKPWPTLRPLGAIIYLFSPSLYSNKAIKAVLFGSYSIDFTIAGISNLSLLKSIIR